MRDLDGKTVLITGGGSGIGRTTAETFAKMGCTVAVLDMNAERVEAVVAAITAAGGRAMPLCVDISDQVAVADAVRTVLREWGKIDVLCNNAGIVDRFEPLTETTDETWSRVISVNLTGQFLVSRAVLPSMVGQSRGAIVNTASVAGLRGGAGGAAYTVSKHGVIGLTRSIAWTYRHQGIRCNAVCPGGVETDILQGMGRDSLDPAGLALCLPVLSLGGGLMPPANLADAIVYLASDDARGINGAILPVDQGWSAA